jgi:mannosyl-oligosaccharide alpha-1,2-mannosidase
LSDQTGDRVFEEKANKIYDFMNKTDRPNGLYYNYVNPESGGWCGSKISINLNEMIK